MYRLSVEDYRLILTVSLFKQNEKFGEDSCVQIFELEYSILRNDTSDIRVLGLLPVTKATNERSFSTLRHLNTLYSSAS